MAQRKKVKFTKNVLKSIKELSKQHVKGMFGETSDLIKSIKEEVPEIIEDLKKDVGAVKTIGGIFKGAIKDSLKDLAQGKLTKSAEDQEKAMNAAMFGDDEDGDDFDFDKDFSDLDDMDSGSSGEEEDFHEEDESGNVRITKNINIQNNRIGRGESGVANAFTKATKVSSKATFAAGSLVANAVERNNSTLQGILKSTSGIAELTSFFQEHAEFFNSKFHEDILTQATEINKGIQILVSSSGYNMDGQPTGTISYDENQKTFDSMGKFSLKNYIKQLKEPITDILDQADMIKMALANPLGSLLGFGINFGMDKLLPGYRDAGKRLDKIIAGIPAMLNLKMEEWQDSDSILKNFIGEHFAINDSKRSVESALSHYEKGAVQFNGKTDKAITEVIPTYLSKILNAIEGKDKDEELMFDYEKGTFRKRSEIRRELRRKEESDLEYSDSLTTVKDALKANRTFESREDEERFDKEIAKIIRAEFKNKGLVKGTLKTDDVDKDLLDEYNAVVANMTRSQLTKFNRDKMAYRSADSALVDEVLRNNTSRMLMADSLAEADDERRILEKKVVDLEQRAAKARALRRQKSSSLTGFFDIGNMTETDEDKELRATRKELKNLIENKEKRALEDDSPVRKSVGAVTRPSKALFERTVTVTIPTYLSGILAALKGLTNRATMNIFARQKSPEMAINADRAILTRFAKKSTIEKHKAIEKELSEQEKKEKARQESINKRRKNFISKPLSAMTEKERSEYYKNIFRNSDEAIKKEKEAELRRETENTEEGLRHMPANFLGKAGDMIFDLLNGSGTQRMEAVVSNLGSKFFTGSRRIFLDKGEAIRRKVGLKLKDLIDAKKNEESTKHLFQAGKDVVYNLGTARDKVTDALARNADRLTKIVTTNISKAFSAEGVIGKTMSKTYAGLVKKDGPLGKLFGKIFGSKDKDGKPSGSWFSTVAGFMANRGDSIAELIKKVGDKTAFGIDKIAHKEELSKMDEGTYDEDTGEAKNKNEYKERVKQEKEQLKALKTKSRSKKGLTFEEEARLKELESREKYRKDESKYLKLKKLGEISKDKKKRKEYIEELKEKDGYDNMSRAERKQWDRNHKKLLSTENEVFMRKHEEARLAKIRKIEDSKTEKDLAGIISDDVSERIKKEQESLSEDSRLKGEELNTKIKDETVKEAARIKALLDKINEIYTLIVYLQSGEEKVDLEYFEKEMNNFNIDNKDIDILEKYAKDDKGLSERIKEVIIKKKDYDKAKKEADQYEGMTEEQFKRFKNLQKKAQDGKLKEKDLEEIEKLGGRLRTNEDGSQELVSDYTFTKEALDKKRKQLEDIQAALEEAELGGADQNKKEELRNKLEEAAEDIKRIKVGDTEGLEVEGFSSDMSKVSVESDYDEILFKPYLDQFASHNQKLVSNTEIIIKYLEKMSNINRSKLESKMEQDAKERQDKEDKAKRKADELEEKQAKDYAEAELARAKERIKEEAEKAKEAEKTETEAHAIGGIISGRIGGLGSDGKNHTFGEYGKEAVIPLEHDTGWANTIAKAIWRPLKNIFYGDSSAKLDTSPMFAGAKAAARKQDEEIQALIDIMNEIKGLRKDENSNHEDDVNRAEAKEKKDEKIRLEKERKDAELREQERQERLAEQERLAAEAEKAKLEAYRNRKRSGLTGSAGESGRGEGGGEGGGRDNDEEESSWVDKVFAADAGFTAAKWAGKGLKKLGRSKLLRGTKFGRGLRRANVGINKASKFIKSGKGLAKFSSRLGRYGKVGKLLKVAGLGAGALGSFFGLSKGASAIAKGAEVANVASKGAKTAGLLSRLASPISGVAKSLGGLASATGVGTKVLGALGKAGSFAGTAAKFGGRILGKAALPLQAALSIYDAVSGFNNAGEVLGKDEGDISTQDKMHASASKVLSGLTFGLLGNKASKFLLESPSSPLSAIFNNLSSITTNEEQELKDLESRKNSLTQDEKIRYEELKNKSKTNYLGMMLGATPIGGFINKFIKSSGTAKEQAELKVLKSKDPNTLTEDEKRRIRVLEYENKPAFLKFFSSKPKPGDYINRAEGDPVKNIIEDNVNKMKKESDERYNKLKESGGNTFDEAKAKRLKELESKKGLSGAELDEYAYLKDLEESSKNIIGKVAEKAKEIKISPSEAKREDFVSKVNYDIDHITKRPIVKGELTERSEMFSDYVNFLGGTDKAKLLDKEAFIKGAVDFATKTYGKIDPSNLKIINKEAEAKYDSIKALVNINSPKKEVEAKAEILRTESRITKSGIISNDRGLIKLASEPKKSSSISSNVNAGGKAMIGMSETRKTMASETSKMSAFKGINSEAEIVKLLKIIAKNTGYIPDLGNVIASTGREPMSNLFMNGGRNNIEDISGDLTIPEDIKEIAYG